LSKKCAAEIKSAEIKTCQNLEKPQNLEPAEKTTYTVQQDFWISSEWQKTIRQNVCDQLYGEIMPSPATGPGITYELLSLLIQAGGLGNNALINTNKCVF
jgi:hypothetical protein